MLCAWESVWELVLIGFTREPKYYPMKGYLAAQLNDFKKPAGKWQSCDYKYWPMRRKPNMLEEWISDDNFTCKHHWFSTLMCIVDIWSRISLGMPRCYSIHVFIGHKRKSRWTEISPNFCVIPRTCDGGGCRIVLLIAMLLYAILIRWFPHDWWSGKNVSRGKFLS